MPAQFLITEPHPSAKGAYMHSGRGGAGNTFKTPKVSNGTTARGPASLFEAGLPASATKFSSGRGGAGNIHKSTERTIFSFDEELQRQTTREKKMNEGTSWHVGRGGAGNWSSSRPITSRKDSSSSTDSDRSGFLGRLSQTLERR